MPRKQPAKAAPPPEPEETEGADLSAEEKDAIDRDAAGAPTAEEERAAEQEAEDARATEQQEANERAEPEAEASTEGAPPVSEEAVKPVDEAKGSGRKTRATTRKKASGEEEAKPDSNVRALPPPALAQTAGLDDTEDYLKILWYGIGGTTKTTSALDILNVGDPGKILVINAEAGLKAAALRRRGIDTSKVQLWPDPKSGEGITYDGLISVYNRLEKDLAEDPDSWCAVVMDSSTEVLQLLLDNIRRKLYEEQQEKLARSTSGRVGELRGRFETATEDYTEVNNMLRQVLRDIRYLPCHFLLTALERSDENKETKRTVYGPAVSPSFQGSLLGFVDIAIRTAAFVGEDGTSRFTGRTMPSQYENAKDRYGILPANMIEPTSSRIAGYILGTITEENDPLLNDEESAKAVAETERRATTGRQQPVKRGNRKSKDEDNEKDEAADKAAS